MAGAYGPKTVWRAAKADILSLLFFEIGLFGWMAIFQIGIFGWRLPMDTVTYWWMMQVSLTLWYCRDDYSFESRSVCFLVIGLRFLSIGG